MRLFQVGIVCALVLSAHALAQQKGLRAPTREQLGKLFKQLASEDRTVRLAAAQELGTYDELPFAAIQPLLNFARQEVRQTQRENVDIPTASPHKEAFGSDFTELKRIQTAPPQFVDRPCTVYGVIEPDDDYKLGYRNAEKTHYSLAFTELTDPTTQGQRTQVYLGRRVGKGVMEALEATTQKRAVVRALVSIDGSRHEGEDSWETLELLDLQFLDDDGKDWQPSVFGGVRTAVTVIAKSDTRVGQSLCDVLTSNSESEAMKQVAIQALKAAPNATKRAAAPKLLAAHRNPKHQAQRAWIAEGVNACATK